MARATTRSQAKYFNFMMQQGFNHKAEGSHKKKENEARGLGGWVKACCEDLTFSKSERFLVNCWTIAVDEEQ